MGKLTSQERQLQWRLIPEVLRTRRQWVIWRTIIRDGDKSKVLFQPNGVIAKSNDSRLWSMFSECLETLRRGDATGVGYVFSLDDPYCGIDLDGCRVKETGGIAPWAVEVLRELDSYSEVSPSGTGVKVFVEAKWPFATGKRKTFGEHKGIEVYDKLRYFAVTGLRLADFPREIQERQAVIEALAKRFWPEPEAPKAPARTKRATVVTVERARRYASKIEPAISGQGGHNQTFKTACGLLRKFNLSREELFDVLCEWNLKCDPPWSERELWHKIDGALKGKE